MAVVEALKYQLSEGIRSRDDAVQQASEFKSQLDDVRVIRMRVCVVNVDRLYSLVVRQQYTKNVELQQSIGRLQGIRENVEKMLTQQDAIIAERDQLAKQRAELTRELTAANDLVQQVDAQRRVAAKEADTYRKELAQVITCIIKL